MLIKDCDYMDMDLCFAYRYLANKDILDKMHSHNFHEYFLIVSGSITHTVNGHIDVLYPGDLIFIRKDDIHKYSSNKNEKCEMINISFSEKYFEDCCGYIGDVLRDRLILPDLPPMVRIPNSKIHSIIQKHGFLNFTTGQDANARIKFKFLLLDILSMFLTYNQNVEINYSKYQLECMIEQMNSQEYIEEGLPAMIRIFGFSHGHLCRVMKEYLDITPNEYLTELRMTYASNLLIYSNMDVLTISLKVGYSSLSHFIKNFRTRFGVSPLKYRQAHSKNVLEAIS